MEAPDLTLTRWVLDSAQAVCMERRAVAMKWRAIVRTLELARREPWALLGVDSPARGRDAERLAESAAVAELAVQHTASEGSIRDLGAVAARVMTALPRLWERFEEGLVPEASAREAARVVAELPEQLWASFDAEVAAIALRLTPAKFRLRARGLRERLHPVGADARHAVARDERRVWVEHDRDGMSWLGAYLPSAAAQRAMARIDAHAFDLARADDETRTMAQLRADVFSDVLSGGPGVSTSVSVALTIPMLSLLGAAEAPAVLEGVGPIPLEQAKRLAGEATSFVRVLTDPVGGTVLDMEGRTRRIPRAMRRWLQHRDQVCTFPGCARSADRSDLDHTLDVQYGGATSHGNLAHLCRRHHRLKHETRWRYTQTPRASAADPPRVRWTSPLGHTIDADPPPF